MQWTSVISRCDETAEALEDVIDQIWRRLDGAPDFIAVFASRHLASSATMIPRSLRKAFANATIVGCTADSVIGDGAEEERRPAISVTAARLPGVRLRTTLVRDTTDARWLDSLPTDGVSAALVLLDSATTDGAAVLAALDERLPDAPKFGGLASGGSYAGDNVLFSGDLALREGAVVVCFDGNVVVETIVAQGCRAIGEPLNVARSDGNVVLEFERGLPQTVLERLYAELPPEDQRLIPTALHLGIGVGSPHDDTPLPGGYLVRPITGVDPNSGALTTRERITPGEFVQFQLRDARSSSEDLRTWLERREQSGAPPPYGVLLFSCVERGEGLFGHANHDTDMFVGSVGQVPIGGFFCAGEIGAVGGRTCVHFYTSSFALFRPRDES